MCSVTASDSEVCLDRRSIESRKRARRKSIDNRQLLISISDNNYQQVNNLLEKVDINFKDQDGCTFLHWAVETGNVKIIDKLLKKGVDVHSKNGDNESPVDIAKQINRPDIEKLLHIVDNKSNVSAQIRRELKRERSTSPDHEVWINPVHGYIYQLKVLMLFLHRGLSCKYSFRVGTEIKEAQKFDDLVFEYMHENKKVYRLLQAKHKIDESKKITVYHLLTSDTKGDYSLVKYFYSFQACKKDNFFKDGYIKDVIICTNIDFDYSDLKKSNIELIKVLDKDDILDIKSNEKEPTRYKFSNSIVNKLKSKLKPSTTVEEIENFLKHLTFAVNQPNEEELGQIVKREIGREIGFLDTENAYNKLLIRMINLMLGKENCMFLSHEEGKAFFDDMKKEIPIWFNIQNPISSFTGRVKYLKQIHEVLMKNSCVCISGMGGVGKSQLIRKYIVDYGSEYGNQVVWINAESYRSAVDCFCQLASDKLNISLKNSEGEEKHIKSVLTEVYQLFSKAESLFIFDNAEKYKCTAEFDCGIDQFLPCLASDSIKPHIIITSRNQKWPKSIKTVLLEPLKKNEAKQLVEKVLVAKSEESKEMIVKLCEKLECLPLALQQAVAYINMQKEKSACVESSFVISDYIDAYSNMTEKCLNFESSDDSYNDYNKNVYTTWNMTFEALKVKEYGSDALDLLKIISFLLPENISIDFLLIFFTDKEKLSSAIGLLKQYSIVNVQHKALSIHRLIQEVVRLKLKEQNEDIQVLQNALNLLNKKNINFKNVDHVILLCRAASKHSELIEGYSHVYCQVTRALLECDRIQEAHSIGIEAMNLQEESPQMSINVQKSLLAIKSNVAVSILQKGEYERALEQLQELLELEILMYGPSKRKVLITKHNIALAHYRLGRHKKALECHYENLHASSKHLGENDSHTLICKRSISILLDEQGKHEEAMSMLQEIYHAQSLLFGVDHSQTLDTRKSIASILSKLQRTDEALKMLQEIRDYQETILPENHPELIRTKRNIADVYSNKKKYDLSLKMYRELYDIQMEKFGENHPDVIDLNVQIADTLDNQGEIDEAMKIYKNAFNKQKKMYGLMHPLVLRTQSAIADIYVKRKNYTDAFKLFEEVLTKRTSIFGESHPDTLATRRRIVVTLVDQKNYDEALKRSIEDLAIVENIYGKNHPETLIERGNIGTVYSYKYEYAKSLEILAEVLNIEESTYGKDHINCQTTKKNLTLITNHLLNLSEEQGKSMDKFAEKVTTNQLITLTKNGNISELERLLKNGVDVNLKDIDGRTSLHHATNMKATNIVKLLLDHGADATLMSKKNNTPLHIATLKNDKESVGLLLNSIANRDQLKKLIDVQTKTSGSTCLHIAAKMGSYDILICLLKYHATFDIKDNSGKDALDIASNEDVKKLLKTIKVVFADCASKTSNFEFYEKLTRFSLDEYCAVMNTRNSDGRRLIQVAIANKRLDLLNNLLVQKRAMFRYVLSLPTSDVELTKKEVTDLEFEIYLYLKKSHYCVQLWKDLMSSNDFVSSSPDARCKLGYKLLKDAQSFVSKYHKYACKLNLPLEEPNIDSIIQVLDIIGFTEAPETLSIISKGKTTVSTCMEMLQSQSKADLQLFIDILEIGIEASVDGLLARLMTAELFNAVIRKVNYLEFKDFDFELVDINVQDTEGRTMLHHASNSADEHMVELLLKNGAEIFVTSNMGNTPLHIAVSKNQMKIVELLLEKLPLDKLYDFVDIKTSSSGSTALHVAAKKGYFDIVKYLLMNHATYCSLNKDGKTPIDLCNDMTIINFFKLIHELFENVKQARAADVVRKLSALPLEELLAVMSTRNDQGLTLSRMAILNKQQHLASQILQLVPKIKKK